MPEPPQPTQYTPTRPYYGSGYAGVGFRGIGGDLLRTFPRLTPDADDEPPIDPTEPAFASHGAHLLAPVVSGPGGFRSSPCPVCRSHEILPHAAGGWVPLRCSTCGTEFVASDGSTPPPAPPPLSPDLVKVKIHLPLRRPAPAVPTGLFAPILPGFGVTRMARCPVCHSLEDLRSPGGWVNVRCGSCGTEFTATDGSAAPPPPPVPPAPTPALLRRNLVRWVATGEPERWVAYRKGVWGESDLSGLMDSLVFSDFWPIDRGAVRLALTEVAERYRASHPLPRRRTRAFAHWATSLPALSEGRWELCPGCRRTHAQVFDDDADTETIVCPGCRLAFTVGLARALRRLPPPPPPPPPRKRRLWVEVGGCARGIWTCSTAGFVILVLLVLMGFLVRSFQRFLG